MPLGTLDRSPPPLFRQGYSALTKVVFCSALALFLMVADRRFQLVVPLRAALATALAPLQSAVRAPVAAVVDVHDYAQGLARALAERDAAQRRLAAQAERASRVEQLQAENARLRALLDLRPALTVHALSAEVLYEMPDPYSRKVFLDRGQVHGIKLGSPVINDAGVLGQVTRLYPLNAEVSLLTDKDASIPVLNTRNGQRGVAFGTPLGAGLELRFMATNADVQVGDPLTTSGVDGVYPPGLAVAKVASVDRRAESGFARVLLKPAAPTDDVRHVLVLEPLSAQLPARPEPPADEANARPARRGAAAAASAASVASAASAAGGRSR